MTPPPARPSHHRGRRRALPRPPRTYVIVLAAILVLGLGAGAALLLVRGSTSTPSPAPAPSASASADAAAAGSAATGANKPAKTGAETTGKPTKTGITVRLPDQLGGRAQLTDPDYVGVAAGLDITLQGVPADAGTVGGIYGSPAKGDIVLVAAASADLADPAGTLNTAFIDAAVGGLPLTGVTTVAAGPLGGAAKCGKAEAGGANLVMCGWADASSTGRIIWYFTSVATAQAEFAELRAEIEQA